MEKRIRSNLPKNKTACELFVIADWFNYTSQPILAILLQYILPYKVVAMYLNYNTMLKKWMANEIWPCM